MQADFCVEALREAFARYGALEIMNTDQGSQFTGAEFTDELKAHGIAISMDGRGQWRDNVFVERLWKTVEYEEVYLKPYDSVAAARAANGAYLDDFYNRRQPHSAHEAKTPDIVYFASLLTPKAAA
jgi:putative transposase